MKNKKQVLMNSLLATLMVAGLCLPPTQGREARAAPNSTLSVSVTVQLISTPPKTMCVDDIMPVVFAYSVEIYYVTSTGLEPAPTSEASIESFIGKATSGYLTPSSWSVSGGKGSGTFSANYMASKTGKGSITISGSPYTAAGNTQADFEIVDCVRTVKIAASESRTYEKVDFKSKFHALGGIAINKGAVSGGGQYTFTQIVTYKNPNPELKCEVTKRWSGSSTFTAEGRSSNDAVTLSIDFKPFDYNAVEFYCIDSENVETKVTAIPAGTLIPNDDVKIKNMEFQPGQTMNSFIFGHGGGNIWLIKIKGKKK